MSSTKEILVHLAVALVAVIAIVILTNSTNDTYQENCEARGGKYHRSLDAGKSLCELPTK
jgi:hypothetical protein